MIFISIASYYDGLLRHTVLDAIARAKYKNDLVFGIVEQTPFPYRLNPNSEKIRYVGIEPHEARGACWARSLCMSLYEGEKFFFQIDSHMAFDDGWDEDLIHKLEKCPSSKPIITNYPHEFDVVDKEVIKKPYTKGALCTVACGDFEDDKENYTIPFIGAATDEMLVPGCMIAGGCLFTFGSFIDEVPYDPFFYFIGEEQSLSIRAYTHGWDIFHVPTSIYHLYATENTPSYRPKHWDEHQDKIRKQRWWERDKHSKERLKKLVTNQHLGAYGLGQARTLRQFEEFSGVDYTNRIVHEKAKRPKI